MSLYLFLLAKEGTTMPRSCLIDSAGIPLRAIISEEWAGFRISEEKSRIIQVAILH